MKRLMQILPILLILALATVACSVTARAVLPRIDAALASEEQAEEGGDGPAAANTPQPTIDAFWVEPASGVKVGRSLTATWSTTGGPVRLCLVPGAPAGAPRCFDGLPPAGSLGVRLDRSLSGPLKVQLAVAPDEPYAALETLDLGLVCEFEWFAEPDTPGCPDTPAYETNAAAQRYEHGWMLWVDEPGRYLALTDEPLEPGSEAKRYLSTYDPLDITGNTSDAVQAPEGLFAPVSGFGLIWRGDARGTGYRDAMGWARNLEFGYQAQYQCDARPPAEQTCYVTHPEGWIVELHPDGSWTPADNPRTYR